MTDNESLCCDQEHALLLQETGLMKDIPCDGSYRRMPLTAIGKSSDDWGWAHGYYIGKDESEIKTYRLDKILAKLPEWCFYYKTESFGYVDPDNCLFASNKTTPRLRNVVRERMRKRIGARVDVRSGINGITRYFTGCELKWDSFIINEEFIEDLITKILSLQETFIKARGQAALNAAAKLLHLLFKEGLIDN